MENSAKNTNTQSFLSKGSRLLFDTNIWRYIVEAGLALKVNEAAWRAGIDIAVAPVLVDEVRQFEDSNLRKRILATICAPNRLRLLPDTYLESEEIFNEICRVDPTLQVPNRRMLEYRRLRYDWIRRSGGFWDRAGRDIKAIVTDESLRSDHELALAREEARANRKAVASRNARGEATPLTLVGYEFTEPVAGFGTGVVDYWRVPSLHFHRKELSMYTSPIREWLDCRLDVFELLANPERMNRLWLLELQATGLPRQWLRGAHEFLQSWHKITAGTPRDSQLAVHLVDLDVLVTSDKNLAEIVRRCHAEAPFRCAAPLQLPGGIEAVETLVEALSTT